MISNSSNSASSTDIVTLNGECFMMFHNVFLSVFHDVLQVVNDVLLVVHDVSQCFTSVSWYFTMFNNVLCLVSLTTIGIADCAATDHLRDSNNVTGIGDNSEIGNDAALIVAIAMKVISC